MYRIMHRQLTADRALHKVIMSNPRVGLVKGAADVFPFVIYSNKSFETPNSESVTDGHESNSPAATTNSHSESRDYSISLSDLAKQTISERRTVQPLPTSAAHHLTSFLRKHSRISNGAQERSSSTNLREINSFASAEYTDTKCRVYQPIFTSFQRVGPPSLKSTNVVATVDPNKLAEKKQKRLHIGNLQSFRPCIARHEQSSPVVGPHFWHGMFRKPGLLDIPVLPIRHQSLSILPYAARKTSHWGRTTPPSCIKWWSCIFRERVWPLDINWFILDFGSPRPIFTVITRGDGTIIH